MTSRVFDLRLSARASGSVGSTSRLASSSRITQTGRCPYPVCAVRRRTRKSSQRLNSGRRRSLVSGVLVRNNQPLRSRAYSVAVQPAVAGFGRQQSEGIADAFEARKYPAPLLRSPLGDEFFERRPGHSDINLRVRLGNPLAKLFGRGPVQKQVGE